jgi:UDPglucose 6-dehydrogenase
MKNITVIGTGYVGLVTGVCFAHKKNKVICVDNDQSKLEKLRKDICPIYEPGLEEIMQESRKDGYLSYTDNLKSAALHGEVIFLCLPTPQGENGMANTSYIVKVVEDLATIFSGEEFTNQYKVLAIKSTVPISFNEQMEYLLAQKLANITNGFKFNFVSNPEFLREGSAVWDFFNPDRVVAGSSSSRAIQTMKELYQEFLKNDNDFLAMDFASSETTKYASNSFLATKISFVNELANLCEKTGANIEQVAHGMGLDSRIGKQFLKSGIGYGGSCFPKDTSALLNMSYSYNSPLKILEAVKSANESQKRIIIQKCREYFNNHLAGKTFAVWGLTFKPNTDDVRDAPAIPILDELTKEGAIIQAFDPVGMDQFKKHGIEGIIYSNSKYEALENADCLLILTEWDEFKQADISAISDYLESKVIIDGRNVFEPNIMEENGFYYNSMGRKTVEKTSVLA